MRYLVITKETADKIGIKPQNHLQAGDEIIINEKELSFSNVKGDTVEDKAKEIGCELQSIASITSYIDKNKFV